MGFKEMINQKDLLERFIAVMKEKPDNMKNISKQVGISMPTLSKFAAASGELDFKRLCKIEKWININEKGKI